MENSLTFDKVLKDKIVFKIFGLAFDEIDSILEKIHSDHPFFAYNIDSLKLDAKITLEFFEDVSLKDIDIVVKQLISFLDSNIYADEDVSLEQRLFDLLSLRKLTISIAESITGGKIASKIVSLDGASDVFFEGIVAYNSQSKITRLSVSEKSLAKHSAVSSQVCFEMAFGLLNSGNCDMSISITGFAGSVSKPNENDGLCYIGIGINNDVQVYKHNLFGDRNEVIENAANLCLFLAVKTILNL